MSSIVLFKPKTPRKRTASSSSSSSSLSSSSSSSLASLSSLSSASSSTSSLSSSSFASSSSSSSSLSSSSSSSSSSSISVRDEQLLSFADLGVSPGLVHVCEEMGLKRPTDIQRVCIPSILKGNDVIGRAKTGSGKTAAFAIPILQQLSTDPYGIYAVVLTPTRELAFQIAEQFRALGVSMNLRDTIVIGGQDMQTQAMALQERPHIVIATPGRLRDHIENSSTPLPLDHVRFLVLDEADRLFETDSFGTELKVIVNAIPSATSRQTLLFSATMPESLPDVGTRLIKEEKQVERFDVCSNDDAFVQTLDQRYVFMPAHTKECYLAYLLTKTPLSDASTIIFTSTRSTCELLEQVLLGLSIDCVSLHSNLNQGRRLAALGKFRSGFVRVLICTDLGSRGLDIPTVKLVVNYDTPKVVQDYIHRVGRTARAGRGGLAVTLVSPQDIPFFTEIEEFVSKKMQEYPLKTEQVLEKRFLNEVTKVVILARQRISVDFGLTSKQMKNNKKPRRSSSSKNQDSSSSSHDSDYKDNKNNESSTKPAQKKMIKKESKSKSDNTPKQIRSSSSSSTSKTSLKQKRKLDD